ncbi:hypothetical protein D3OALGB2SA_2310 [Olavius algarvensis associated proteobacterium Delta 3]|nr:hypothetical protein D3OALGB2SA_2310 [Olavius algarvensis associated proteobacterium Delta 3]
MERFRFRIREERFFLLYTELRNTATQGLLFFGHSRTADFKGHHR